MLLLAGSLQISFPLQTGNFQIYRHSWSHTLLAPPLVLLRPGLNTRGSLRSLSWAPQLHMARSLGPRHYPWCWSCQGNRGGVAGPLFPAVRTSMGSRQAVSAPLCSSWAPSTSLLTVCPAALRNPGLPFPCSTTFPICPTSSRFLLLPPTSGWTMSVLSTSTP